MSENNGFNQESVSQDKKGKSRDGIIYDELNLPELKELAKEKGVLPEGNKSSRETWVKALTSAEVKEQLKEGEELSSFRQPEKAESLSQIAGKPGSAEAQELIFDKVLNRLEQRGISLDSVSVTFDGKEALAYQNSDVIKQQLTDSQAQLLRSAITDPQNFEGSVTIKSGNRILLKIENGQVTRDTFGLTEKSTKVEVESSTESLYQKYSQNSQSQGLGKTKQVVENALSDGVGKEQVKKMIRREDKGYYDFAQSTNSEMAEQDLNRLVNQASEQVQIKQEQPSQAQAKEKTLSRAR